VEISSASGAKLTESIISTLIETTMETTREVAAVAATQRVRSAHLGRILDTQA